MTKTQHTRLPASLCYTGAMRYFDDRAQAGRMLADQLIDYKTENCAVIALSEGGVLVGAEIARRVHAAFYFLATAAVRLPAEPDPLAMMSSAGTFTYNSLFSAGQLEEFNADYRQVIDQERLEVFHKLNRLIGKDGVIKTPLLKRHVVILVSDGFNSGLSLDVAADFMKYITVKKLIVAVPISSVRAVDRMHHLADEIHCLGIVENYFTTEHYYKDNTLPNHTSAMELMRNVVFEW